jgi:Domain of unknown function (DUF4149)
MSEERFSEEDLRPSAEERQERIRTVVDRAAASIAVLGIGLWIGGLLALGACAAPFVFTLTPEPFSGYAMGNAFARFDRVAVVCTATALAMEMARTWAARKRGRGAAARVRRLLAVILAAGAVYSGLALTPAINDLYRSGARRHEGEAGQELDRIHHRASTLGSIEALLGAALVALHVFTLRPPRRPEDDDDDDDEDAPLPPGPR